MTTESNARDAVIADSWRRSRLCGVDPRSCLAGDDSLFGINDGSGRIGSAASAVLDSLFSGLADSGFVVVLGDRNGHVVDVRAGSGAIRDQVEQSGIVVGRLLSEEAVGTNSIGSVLETRSGLKINGTEHYAEALRKFHCYGHPIVNPITQRLAGVLDISCLGREDSALLVPLVTAAAQDIERELAAMTSDDDHRLVDAFRIGCDRHPGSAVVAIGANSRFMNNTAIQMLMPADHIALQAIVDDHPRRAGSSTTVMHVELDRGSVKVGAAFKSCGAVLVLDFGGSARTSVLLPPATTSKCRLPDTFVAGEPGTGRTTEARRLAGDSETAWLQSFDPASMAEPSWLTSLRESLGLSRTVVVEDVHLLSAQHARRLAAEIEAKSPETRVILTAGPLAELGGEHARLVAQCAERRELLPLRMRRGDLPALIRSMLTTAGASDSLDISLGAIDALTQQLWPGNLAELAALVAELTRNRTRGEITVSDLPEAYRQGGCHRRLTPIEEAERQAIVEALSESGGNKRAAASYLGVSRTTLYRAIRRYRIDTP